MTDKEIKKALECSVKNKCPECPYFHSYPCDRCKKMQKDALDLINRQQAEIEELKKLLDSRHRVIESLENHLIGLPDEIEAEAIKKFADLVDKDINEKLSDSIKEQNPHLYLIHQIVKDRLKEMVGEDK